MTGQLWEGPDGFQVREGACTEEPGPRPGDDIRFGYTNRPCFLTKGHEGAHQSWMPRRVWDVLHWERPNAWVIAPVDSEPRAITKEDARP